ncbi:hypothetical protein [Streptomyces scopuliridis]|uniref:hypothetical protein n=1 Tax=Streptomyces scopuliridis TaxID=452529 RepID=UPI003675BA07
MTHTISLVRTLDDSGLAVSVPVPVTSRYDHPRFQRMERGQYEGQTLWYFTVFTGREAEPEMPLAVYDDKSLTSGQLAVIGTQYMAAKVMWSQARLRFMAGPLLREAAPLWQAWEAARTELHAVFKEFWNIEGSRWRAQLLRLTDAERAARAAAGAWDAAAEKLAELASDQIKAAGYDDELPLADVAREIGLEVSGWRIDHVDAYAPTPFWHRDTPLVGDLLTEIEKQRERLREVAHLAGDRATV